MENKWSIAGTWNEISEQERREPKERNYINASDIGKPFLDRYLKMKGTPETNPFEYRVLRILSAGDEFHHLLRKVFEKAGIVLDAEKYLEVPATDKTLKVLGYADLILGGKVDIEKAEQAIRAYEFSKFIEERALKIVRFFAENYPDGFKPLPCEVKSVNSMAFVAHQQGKGYLKEAYPHHALQLYTYLKGLGMGEGRLLYVSKDNLLLEEHVIMHPAENLEQAWREDVETMSGYYLSNTEPPREPDLLQDEVGKWKPNWRIERSPFLTRITGKSKEDWQAAVGAEAKAKNAENRKPRTKKK